MKKIFINISAAIILISCNEPIRTAEDLERYVNNPENEFVQKKEIEGVSITAQYMPTEGMMLREYQRVSEEAKRLHADSMMSSGERGNKLQALQKELDELRSTYGKSIYIVLTIGYADNRQDLVYGKLQQGESEYGEWAERLVFGLRDFIYLETSKVQEIPLDVYQMDQTYGLTKYRKFLLAFPGEFNDEKLRDKSQQWLKVNIKEFGLKTGKVSFQFSLPHELPPVEMSFLKLVQ